MSHRESSQEKSSLHGNQDPDVEEFEERIIDIDVSSEMETSYLEYAYSVIYAGRSRTPGTA